MTITGYKIRCEVQVDDFRNPFTTQTKGRTPAIPAGVDVRFEFLFKSGDEVVDVANFASVSLKVMAAARTGAPYMDQSTGTFDTTADQDSFDDLTKQHCAFDFTAAETELPGTVSGTEYYLVLQALDAGNVVLFEAWTRFVAIRDGLPEEATVIQPGNIVPGGATYSGGGEYSLAVTSGVYYKWTKGANDTSVENPDGGATVTVSDSNFLAASTSVMLNGTAGQPVTAIVRKSPYLTADEVAALVAAATGAANYGGTAEPEGAQTAAQWAIYTQLDGGGALVRQWVKASAGTGNTGWI